MSKRFPPAVAAIGAPKVVPHTKVPTSSSSIETGVKEEVLELPTKAFDGLIFGTICIPVMLIFLDVLFHTLNVPSKVRFCPQSLRVLGPPRE
uniref:Wsv422 n=1 Tax=White spot syndrome virus TaxID=92652 RepID=A0A2U9G8M8_WSSV|nr:wsv422 [Shrimp white spot syndrome virus]AWQ61847.1 wsv422 [Shrimp white spot syndrome virus]